MTDVDTAIRWGREQVYWHITRPRERLVIALAHALPRWLKYRVFIDVAAEVTTSPAFSRRIVPEVTMMEVLSAYEVKRP